MTDQLDQTLLSEIRTLPILDAHEHLPAWESRRTGPDFFKEYLHHYLSSDLVSSGMPQTLLERLRTAENLAPEEKWKLAEPYWENCRQTGYCRSLDIAVQLIYGIDGIRRETVGALSEAYDSARTGGHHFDHVLHQVCHIQKCLLDEDLGCDRSYFDSLYRIDKFVMPMSAYSIRHLGQEASVNIETLEDWCEATDLLINDAIVRGAVGFKCALAYNRSLRFEEVSRADAEAAFRFMNKETDPEDFQRVGKPFQDYMMHFVLDRLQEKHKTLQIHTGLHEGNGNFLPNSNAELLNNLFLSFPDMRFDILHNSYPYSGPVGALCKNFPNVFINFAWAYIISPSAAERTLNEYLDLVPVNKITGFGGDYCFIDGVAGHWYFATQCIAKVLSDRIRKKILTQEQSRHVAEKLLYENPYRVYYQNL